MPDDAGVSNETRNVCIVECGDTLHVKASKGPPEVLPLAQNREPTQPSLKTFEANLFKQPCVVVHGATPLVIVVGDVQRVVTTPPAPTFAVGVVAQQ